MKPRFKVPEPLRKLSPDSAFTYCPDCGALVSKRLGKCFYCEEKRRAESIDTLGAAVVCILLGFVALLLMLAT